MPPPIPRAHFLPRGRRLPGVLESLQPARSRETFFERIGGYLGVFVIALGLLVLSYALFADGFVTLP